MSAASAPANSVCAVVPAAGRGSRLGADIPKVFVPLFPSFTIWNAIHEKLSPVCERMVLVLSPEGGRFLDAHRAEFHPDSFAGTALACQQEPLGMGDAIFGAAQQWQNAENLLVVWGDQFNLSAETLRRCLEMHTGAKKPALTLPLVRMDRPYVEYVFDASDGLAAVRQSREGDKCASHGLADMGIFLLTGGTRLLEEWARYRAVSPAGSMTQEINFLPFLVHLSVVARWSVCRCECNDPREALGINTPEDLAQARQIMRERDPARFSGADL